MEIQIDPTKSDLVLIVNFNGVMNLGYAIFLLDNDGITSLWNPPKTGQNSKTNNGINGLTLNLTLLNPISFYNGKSLDLEFVFRGVDSELPDFIISATFFQQGNAIGNPFIISGKLNGEEQDDSIFITMKV